MLEERDAVHVWRQRIKRAQEKRDEAKKVWDDNLKAFRGALKPPTTVWNDYDPWISIELVHSAVRSAVPSLLYMDPQAFVVPKKPRIELDPATGEQRDMSWEYARTTELWLNEMWGESEGNKHVRIAIISAFLAYGAIKVGYAPDFADDEVRGEYAFDSYGNLIPMGEPDATGRRLYKLEKGEYLYNEAGDVVWDEDTELPVLNPGTLQRELFFVEWVPWENILFDIEGGNVFKNHRYVIEEWVRPLEHVQNDPRYLPIRKKVEATETIDKDRPPTYEVTDAGNAVRTDEKRVRGWDIYDFEENRLMVLVDECQAAPDQEYAQNEHFLMDVPMPAGIEHGPFCFLKFNEDPGCWYPRTDAEGMSKVELEYNLTRSQMCVHRNGARARYFESQTAGFAGDDGGAGEREKFASGPSGTVCRVKSTEGIQPARKDQLDNSFFAAIPNIRADFSEVAGQSGEMRGVADADSATQASILAQGADIRNNDRRDNQVQTFIVEIFRKLLQSAHANAEMVQYVRVAPHPDSPNPFAFAEVNPEKLDAEAEVSLVVGSTQAKNSQARVALIERVVTLIAQNPIIAASPTLMRRMFDALDIRDEKLEAELAQIGNAALQQLQGQPQPGAPGFQSNNQTLGAIENQSVSQENAMFGLPTGARAN